LKKKELYFFHYNETNISICWHFKTTPTKWKQIKFHWWCWCHENCNQPLFTGLILFLHVTSGHWSHFDGELFWCRLVDIKIVYDRSLCPFLYWCGNTKTWREYVCFEYRFCLFRRIFVWIFELFWYCDILCFSFFIDNFCLAWFHYSVVLP
jgi:hypothetical protein